ncbi:B3 DNA-binding domain protein [Heracleum sosnowskyi]|uniref:B3 DNA-binding domain protein n=1 Tax=Heracleum sosnowskyi TaxID=360622 RepID=A0AAD8MHL1_9APIA|nr:B3 DNA-binding domain protein [Heracleum sosnowskyi]
MASSYWSNSPAKSFRFFKIVLTDIDSHSKLMIPRKFVKIFGKNMDNRIHLSAPSGSVWSVDLEKQKDEVWMQNGWPEFAKFYSISFGYLLVFEYKGDAKFEVLIFDPIAVEIDYP